MDRQITVNIINIGSMHIDEVNIDMRTGEVKPHNITIDKKDTFKLDTDSSSNYMKILRHLHNCSS